MRKAQPVADSDGTQWIWASTSTAEIYDPSTNAWTPTMNLATNQPSGLNFDRAYHAAILLPTGQVLIVGGYHSDLQGNVAYPNTTELFDPSTGVFSVMDTLNYGISSPQLALLPTGNVFVAGQYEQPMTLSSGANLASADMVKPLKDKEIEIDATPLSSATTVTVGSDLFGIDMASGNYRASCCSTVSIVANKDGDEVYMITDCTQADAGCTNCVQWQTTDEGTFYNWYLHITGEGKCFKQING